MVSRLDETKQSEKLLQDPTHLVQIYREQFRHLRHVENADSIALIFITGAILAIFVLLHLPFLNDDVHNIIGMGIIGVILLGGTGIYGTTRRMTYRMRHLIIINRIGRALGAVKAGIIPASVGSDLPGNLLDFSRRLVLGYRGPVIVFYSVLIWGMVFSLFFELVPEPHSFILATVTGLIIVAFANLTSLLTSWVQLKHEIIALKKEVELGSSTRISLAEQYCEVADSMMRLKPPRLNDALSHYEEALKIEPGNLRARTGFDKLMNWKIKDYR